MPISELNVAINGQDNISGVFKDILNTMSSFSSKTEKQLSGISKALEVLNSSLNATSLVANSTANSMSSLGNEAKKQASSFSSLVSGVGVLTEEQNKLALAFTKTLTEGTKVERLEKLAPMFSEIAKSGDAIGKAGVDAVMNEIAKEEKNLGNEAKNASEKTGLLHTKLSDLTVLKATALTAIYQAIKNIASAGVDLVKSQFLMAFKTGAEIEQTRIAMEAFLGSADETVATMTKLTSLAIATPFKFPELADSTKQLLAYGISADQAVGVTKMLGDIASGVNAPIGDLAYLFGTMAASGRIYTRDINQLADRGIPILEYLAEVMDADKTAIRGMVEAGEVGFNDVALAMQNMTTEGGKYHDMMLRQAFSLQGIWSTLADNWEIMLREVIGITQTGEVEKGSIFDIIRIAGMELVMWMDENKGNIKKFFEDFVKGAVSNVLKLVDVLGGKEGLTNIFYGFMNVLGFLGKAFLMTFGIILSGASWIKEHKLLVTTLSIAYASLLIPSLIGGSVGLGMFGKAIKLLASPIGTLITGLLNVGKAFITGGISAAIGTAIGTFGISLLIAGVIGLVAYLATHREALDNWVIAPWKYFSDYIGTQLLIFVDNAKIRFMQLFDLLGGDHTAGIRQMRDEVAKLNLQLEQSKSLADIRGELKQQRESGATETETGGGLLGLDFDKTMEKYKKSMDGLTSSIGDTSLNFGNLDATGGEALDALSEKTDKLKTKTDEANDSIKKENRDYKEKKEDKTKAYETGLEQMARDYNDAIAKLDKDLVDKTTELTTKYNEALVKLKADLDKDLLDLANKYAEDSKNAETERNEDIASIIVSKQEDLVKAQEEYNNATTEDEKATAQAKIDTIQAFLDQHQADITESQTEIAALIAYNALDEIDKIKFKYEQEKILRDQKYAQEKADRIAQYNEKVAEEKAQYEADKTKAKADYEESVAERNKRYEDDKVDKEAKFKEDMKILKREHKEKLEELKKHLKEVKKELDDFNNSKTVKKASKYSETSKSTGSDTGFTKEDWDSVFTKIPARATGGPVSSSNPYIVGERGSELFVPATAGKIVNNQEMFANMGRGGATVNIYVDKVGDKIDIDLLGEQIAWKINNTR